MDLLDRLLEHDAWTTRRLLVACGDLPDEQLDREFELGLRTVRATLLHIIRNMEVWTDLMNEGPIRDAGTDARSVASMSARLDRAAADLAALCRGVRERGGWDDLWLDRLDDPPREKSFGGAIAHVITHSMHHRSQVIHMLHRLSVATVPEGDVLGWERQRGTSP